MSTFAAIDQDERAREAVRFSSPAADASAGVPIAAADACTAEELFKSTYPTLAGWVRRLVDDDDTAHEIASESFTRLLSRWPRVTSRRHYLYVIAANLVKDHWRTIQRERGAIRRVTQSGAVDPVTYPLEDVDVRSVIATLPRRLREPFLLRYYGGLGIREVAALLRKPEGTIKADLFAARARLKADVRFAGSADPC